jgi:hypothetical protein
LSLSPPTPSVLFGTPLSLSISTCFALIYKQIFPKFLPHQFPSFVTPPQNAFCLGFHLLMICLEIGSWVEDHHSPPLFSLIRDPHCPFPFSSDNRTDFQRNRTDSLKHVLFYKLMDSLPTVCNRSSDIYFSFSVGITFTKCLRAILAVCPKIYAQVLNPL